MQPVEQFLEERGFDEGLIKEWMSYGRQVQIKAGEILIDPNYPGEEMPLVIEGLLKVSQHEDDQREVFLYYLENGETCSMSITCCLENRQMAIQVKAVTDSLIWMIPMKGMNDWIVRYPQFRRFVFNSYQQRFDELLGTIDSLVFDRLDVRLYNFLLDTKQATGSFEINLTHEQIAKELGTSRVVVSRLLKKLENEERIEQKRNQIEIL